MLMTQDAYAERYYTNGWHDASRSYELRNPATGEVIARVANCGVTEAKQAVDVATEVFNSWKQRSAFERADVLMRWYELIMQHQEDLAVLMSTEMGKAIKESRAEVAYAAGFIKWYAEEAKRVYGNTFPGHTTNKRLMAIKQPVGPVFAITPWNFPAAMVTRKAAPALAAGCTFILKPAEQSPLTALRLAALWEDAGGPAGSLQVLPCEHPQDLSAVFFEDPRIRKITFTGSTEVGRILYKQSAETIKKISLELGGHAPYLVFADADVDKAVKEVIACKFRNAGQTCVCTNRIYVQEGILEAFTSAYTSAVKALRVGDPLKDDTDIGPLVDRQGLDKVKAHVQDAVAKGAKLTTGGNALDGLYFEPTVLTHVTDDMRLMQEETFGPVAPITSFVTDEEAIRRANDTPFGLAAYLYTNDLSRAFKVSEALEYGIVGVNDGVPSAPYAPFGGVKQSGLGREGGPWGIEEYLEVKYISFGLPH